MKRPTAVTVFGILNIVFAAFGIIGIMASAMMFVMAGNGSNNPMIQLLHDSPGYAAYLKVSIVLGLFLSLALLAAGIGLLWLKPWARVFSIAYGIFGIISVPVNTILSYIFMTRPLLEQASQHHNSPEATGAAIGGAIGGMVGGCFGLIYPVLLLIFMLQSKVAAAFKPAVPGLNPPEAGQS